MQCPRCGRISDDNNLNCPHCGEELHGHSSHTPDRFDVTIISENSRLPEKILNERFRIEKSLGRGGMGEILLAEDTKLIRKVAVKVISAKCLADSDARMRFLREAQTASRLDHPNICTIYEVAEENNRDFIIMQYIDGVNLGQLLKMKRLPPGQVVAVALQICDALIEAHRQNIIHRDIKPGNIMIDQNGKVKILDFGLAKIAAEESCEEETGLPTPSITRTGLIMGTAPYLAPEQIKGKHADTRSDIFSFGVVLYEMLEGVNPFYAKESFETLYNIVHKQVVFTKRTPRNLVPILESMLKKDPLERSQSFIQIKADLLKFQMLESPELVDESRNETKKIETNQNWSEGFQRLSSKSTDELSQVIRKLKNLHNSTQVLAAPSFSWKKWGIIFLSALSIAALFFLFYQRRNVSDGTKPLQTSSHLLVRRFEIKKLPEEVADQFQHLLLESLGQVQNLDILSEKRVRDADIDPSDFSSLRNRFNITHVLEGELDDTFRIQAYLHTLESDKSSVTPLQIFGKDWDSILSNQIDSLSQRICTDLTGSVPDSFQPVSILYGTGWNAYKRFYEGMQAWRGQEFSRAVGKFKDALNADPPVKISRYYMAQALEYMGYSLKGQNVINPLISEINQIPNPMRLKILALHDKMHFKRLQQINALKELKQKYPNDKEILFELGEAYFAIGNAVNSKEEYLAALQLDPNYIPAMNHLGYSYSYLGEHQEAVRILESYCQKSPTANAFDSLGDIYFYMGNYSQAENNKVTVLRLDPSLDWPHLTLADIHIMQAKFKEALVVMDRYDKVATGIKQKSDGLCKRAFIQYLNHRFPNALQLANRAIQKYDNPEIIDNTAEYHWMKALILLAMDRSDDARAELDWLKKVVDTYRLTAENFHASFKYYLHLSALLQEKSGDLESADRTLRELTAMKTQNSYWITAYNHSFFMSEYAGFLFRQNRMQEMEAILDMIDAYNSNYTPALWQRVEFHQRLGDKKEKEVLLHIREIYGDKDGEENPFRQRLNRLLPSS